MSIILTLPKARLVEGNPLKWEIQKTRDNPPVVKISAKTGQPQYSSWFNLAIPKQDFFTHILPHLQQLVSTVYPDCSATHPDDYIIDPRGFAWKVINGDSPRCPTGSNKPYNVREGYPGHYVIKVQTSLACPQVVVYQGGQYLPLQESQIKTGDYFVVSVELKVKEDKKGLYWSPKAIELVELGTAITSDRQVDPSEVLGNASTRRHQGFQGVLPPAPSGGQQHAAQYTPPVQQHYSAAAPAQYAPPQQPAYQPPMQQQAQYAPPPAQQAASPSAQYQPPVAPAYDFVQNAVGNGAPPAGYQLPYPPQVENGTAPNAISSLGNPALPAGLPPSR